VAIRLDALANPMVEAVTNRSDIKAQDVLDQQALVSVVAPVQDGQMARPYPACSSTRCCSARTTGLSTLAACRCCWYSTKPRSSRTGSTSSRAERGQGSPAGRGNRGPGRRAVQGRESAFDHLRQLRDRRVHAQDVEQERRTAGQAPRGAPRADLIVSVGPASSGWGTQTNRSTQTQMVQSSERARS